jgi:hypothetical protein
LNQTDGRAADQQHVNYPSQMEFERQSAAQRQAVGAGAVGGVSLPNK